MIEYDAPHCRVSLDELRHDEEVCLAKEYAEPIRTLDEQAEDMLGNITDMDYVTEALDSLSQADQDAFLALVRNRDSDGWNLLLKTTHDYLKRCIGNG